MRKIRPPFRWKAIPLRATALLVGIVAAWLFVGKALGRQEIVSRIGMCRFTLGAGWRYEPFHEDGEIDSIYRPSNPIPRWFQEHLLNRYSDPDIVFMPQHVGPNDVSLQNGHPVISGKPLSTPPLIIDGCPATLETYPSSIAPSTLETHFFLYCPGDVMSYEFVARSYRKGDEIDREMQAIIASFHIDK